jgi:hypothetical protein
MNKPANGHHYFASFGLGWATADTRDEALEKLAKNFMGDIRGWLKHSHVNGEPGIYFWSCKVHAPADAAYKIEWFQPQEVECSDGQEHYLTHATQKKVAFWRKTDA